MALVPGRDNTHSPQQLQLFPHPRLSPAKTGKYRQVTKIVVPAFSSFWPNPTVIESAAQPLKLGRYNAFGAPRVFHAEPGRLTK